MTSIRYCEHELGVLAKTTVDWNNNMVSKVCAMELLANPVILGGPGRTVEVDESQFSRRKAPSGLDSRLCRICGLLMEVLVPLALHISKSTTHTILWIQLQGPIHRI